MEETDIEVLEPQENWEKELPALVDVRTVRVPVQTIIINNEQQIIYGAAEALVCPKCNSIIQQFQPGISKVEIVKALNTDNEKALKSYVYCKKCGQKLSLMRPMPVEAEYEVKEVIL